MSKVSTIQCDFGTGEVGPYFQGRVDLDRYKSSLTTCLNFIPTQQGGLTRRQGTRFVAECLMNNSRLVSFIFSRDTSYILEFSGERIYFYMNNARLMHPSQPITPYSIVTPYLSSELDELQFVQSADILYIVHPNHYPKKLMRFEDTHWGIGDLSLIGGAGNPFPWGEKNYPRTVTFHEDRLFFGGSKNKPQTIWGSCTGDYENFSKSLSNGTITASHAVEFTLNSRELNTIQWMISDEKGLLVGTTGAEWVIRPAANTAAISPVSISAKRSTTFGSEKGLAVSSGKTIIYVQNGGTKLREFNYFYEADGFRSIDLNALADHITTSGIKEIVFQKLPQPLVWCLRNDGVLLGLTYDRDTERLRAAWHRHILGGASDEYGTHAKIESIAVIPNEGQEKLWMIVRRYNNGSWKRYIEYMAPISDENINQEAVLFLDSSLSYKKPIEISYVFQSLGNLSEITVGFGETYASGNEALNSNSFEVGDSLLFSDIKKVPQLNGKRFEIKSVHTDKAPSSNTTWIYSKVLVLDNPTLKPWAVNNGYTLLLDTGTNVHKLVSTIEGLEHLEGETVHVVGDGAVLAPTKVVSGKITLSNPSAKVDVGLNYFSDARIPRLDAGAMDGTSIGKTRRTHSVSILLHQSLNLLLGPNFEDMERLVFRNTNTPLGQAPELFSGIIRENIRFDYDYENQISLRQDQPLPTTILAVMPQMLVQDRG